MRSTTHRHPDRLCRVGVAMVRLRRHGCGCPEVPWDGTSPAALALCSAIPYSRGLLRGSPLSVELGPEQVGASGTSARCRARQSLASGSGSAKLPGASPSGASWRRTGGLLITSPIKPRSASFRAAKYSRRRSLTPGSSSTSLRRTRAGRRFSDLETSCRRGKAPSPLEALSDHLVGYGAGVGGRMLRTLQRRVRPRSQSRPALP